MGGGGGGSGPTVQQQQLEAAQARQGAQLNLEENAQRKSILNAMLGTRVFRGSALSRGVQGNTPGVGGEDAAPAPSRSQLNNAIPPIAIGGGSLLDQRQTGTGNTPSGGAGASGGATAARGGGYGGGSNARGPAR